MKTRDGFQAHPSQMVSGYFPVCAQPEAQAQKLDVPVYMLEGRFDHNANAVLAERWFNRLQASYKELIWFEHSSHSPMISEMERFNQVLEEKVLASGSTAE